MTRVLFFIMIVFFYVSGNSASKKYIHNDNKDGVQKIYSENSMESKIRRETIPIKKNSDKNKK